MGFPNFPWEIFPEILGPALKDFREASLSEFKKMLEESFEEETEEEASNQATLVNASDQTTIENTKNQATLENTVV